MKKLTRAMVNKQHDMIKKYYTARRKAEKYDCKCYECRHYDEVKGCTRTGK